MSERFLEWLLAQTPTVVITVGFLCIILWMYRQDRKESVKQVKEKDDKIDQALKEKDEGLNRFYNALTEWAPIIKATAKNLETNTNEIRVGSEGTKEKLTKIMNELDKIKTELDHLKTYLK